MRKRDGETLLVQGIGDHGRAESRPRTRDLAYLMTNIAHDERRGTRREPVHEQPFTVALKTKVLRVTVGY